MAIRNPAHERRVNAELLGYTSVQTLEPPMPADADLNCWGLAQGQDYTVLFFVPFNETLDD